MNKILIHLISVMLKNISLDDNLTYLLKRQEEIKTSLSDMPHGFCFDFNNLTEHFRSELLLYTIFLDYYNEKKGICKK